jgi:hypothetical protein
MNILKAKGYVYGIILIVCLTGIMVFVYNTVITTIMGIIKGEDYILYDPKQIPLFLLLPAMVVADLFVICLLLPFRKKTDVIMRKLFIPTTVYAISAFAIGIFLSMVISFYPLGTDYYQCKSIAPFHPAVIMPEPKRCVSREHIHQQLKRNNLPMNWNLRHSNPYLFSMMNGNY